MPLDPQAKTLIDMIDSTGAFELTPETPPEQLRQLFAMLAAPENDRGRRGRGPDDPGAGRRDPGAHLHA